MQLLVIATCNRSSKLKRVLDWYRSQELRARVVVLDASSEREHLDANRKSAERCSSFVTLVPTPGQDDVDQRIARFLETVDDEVVAIGNDEDAFFPEFLDQAFEFLETNVQYAVATGRYVTSARPLFGVRRISYWTDRFLSLDVDEPEPALRVINFQRLNGGGVPALCWSVRRKHTFAESCRLIAQLRAWSAQELLDQINCCVLGKISISPQPMLLRDESKKNYKPSSNRDDGRLYIGADDLDRIDRIASERWDRDVAVAVRAVTSWYRAKKSSESYQSRLIATLYCRFNPVPGTEQRKSLVWLQRAIRWFCTGGILMSQVCAYLYFLIYMSRSDRGRRFVRMTRTMDVNKAN